MYESFGVGSVLGTSFRVWGRNIVPFTLITAVLYIPMLLWVMWYWNGGIADDDAPIKFALGTLGLTLVLNAFVTATITFGVVKELQGQRVGIGACILTGFTRMIPTLGVAIASAVCIAAFALPAMLALFGGSFDGAALLVIAAIAPILVVVCMLYVAAPASVIEKPGIIGALGRSRELTRGHKGGVFGILFILKLIGWGVDKLQDAVMKTGDVETRTSAYVSLGVEVLLGSLAAVTAAVAYAQLRAEKDGTSPNELAAVFE